MGEEQNKVVCFFQYDCAMDNRGNGAAWNPIPPSCFSQPVKAGILTAHSIRKRIVWQILIHKSSLSFYFFLLIKKKVMCMMMSCG